jgi:hypothetical protein
MHVAATSRNNFISLKSTKVVPRDSEHDLDWMVIEVEWRTGQRRYKMSAECLTVQEAEELTIWLSSLSKNPSQSMITFIEPCISCIYLVLMDVVVFVFGAEFSGENGTKHPVSLTFPRTTITISS